MEMKNTRLNRNLIWIDPNINSDENQYHKIQLNSLFKNCFYIDSIENYSNHFNSLISRFLVGYFVITSGDIGKELIKIIDQQLKVEKVFVFCFDLERHQKWAKLHNKIKLVEDNMDKIIQGLQRHDYLLSYHNVDYKQAFHFTGTDQFIKYIEIDFIIKLVCMNPKGREISLREFKEFSIEYIEQNYSAKTYELKFLQRLVDCMKDQSENDTDIIKWYTEDSFFYRMINETLRGSDIIKIFFIRIAIYLLNSQLKNQANQQKQKKLTLYRGCVINKKEFELWENEKQPFMFQGFNSTSANKQIALNFAEQALQSIPTSVKNDNIKVLIQIDIDEQQYIFKENMMYPVAIQEFSYFKHEDEYLIPLNTFLKVKYCYQEYEHVIVGTEMSSLNINQQGLNQITLDRKNQIDKILQKNYSKEHFYLSNFLEETNDEQKMKLIINKLFGDTLTICENIKLNDYCGKYYQKIGDYKEALKHFMKCQEMQNQEIGKYNTTSRASTYNNIGLVYDNSGDFKNALENYVKSLKLQKQTMGQNYPQLATTYNNIGSVYKNQGDYQKALSNYFKCLEIQKQTIRDNNLAIARTYNNIGSVYENEGDYKKALENYFKCLEIKRQTIGENNPATATSYNNIGSVYKKQGEYKKSLEYFYKCLTTQKQTIGKNNPAIAITYNNIGSVYDNQGDYKQALVCYFRSLKIKKQTIGGNHPSIAITLSNISYIFEQRITNQQQWISSIKQIIIHDEKRIQIMNFLREIKQFRCRCRNKLKEQQQTMKQAAKYSKKV